MPPIPRPIPSFRRKPESRNPCTLPIKAAKAAVGSVSIVPSPSTGEGQDGGENLLGRKWKRILQSSHEGVRVPLLPQPECPAMSLNIPENQKLPSPHKRMGKLTTPVAFSPHYEFSRLVVESLNAPRFAGRCNGSEQPKQRHTPNIYRVPPGFSRAKGRQYVPTRRSPPTGNGF